MTTAEIGIANTRRRRGDWWKYLLGPWMAGVIWAAFFHVGPSPGFMFPDAARIIFFHVPEAILLVVWFLVAAVFSLLLLMGRGESYDARAAAAAEVGLVCTLLATVSGSIFARVQWGAWWNWDPKQISIVLVLFVYAAYFALRAEVADPDRRARLAAVYAIISGIAVPFAIKVIPQMPVFRSLHPSDTLQPGNMGPDYRLVFNASIIGFFGITYWLYQLRLRVSTAASRVADR